MKPAKVALTGTAILAVAGASWQLSQDLPPTLWVRADKALLTRPLSYEPFIIPKDAAPAVATRIAHDACNVGAQVFDKRFYPPRVYATRSLTRE